MALVDIPTQAAGPFSKQQVYWESASVTAEDDGLSSSSTSLYLGDLEGEEGVSLVPGDFLSRQRTLSSCSSCSCCSSPDAVSPRRVIPIDYAFEGRFDSGRSLSRSPPNVLGHRKRSAEAIRHLYACKLGIRDPRSELALKRMCASRRVSCLPEGFRVVLEKLKGRPDSYGGFLRLMRRPTLLPTRSPSPPPRQTEPPQSIVVASATVAVVAPAYVKAGAGYGGENVCSRAGGPSVGGFGAVQVCNQCGHLSAGARLGGAEGSTGAGVCRREVAPKRPGGLKREGKPKIGAAQGGLRRRIAFSESVAVVHIPSHADYSKRVKGQYWSSPEEIYEMACRNVIEFEMEGGDYNAAVEEDRMYFDESTGELVHPAHIQFDNLGESLG